ncbi:Rho GTPase activation protein, partial [Myxozyma melibiosi]
IFGQPLDAAVERSSTRVISRSQSGAKIIYGPLPVLVAVCGTYLRENGINTQGIFRLSGSAKRVRQLQQVFASPPDFGAKISWQGYTVHDASSILRRYLNSLPEPIVPLDEYDNFRAPNSTATMRKKDIISVVQQLIFHLPVTNRQLLLYILDLLEQFSRHSKKNLMPAANLAAVFQPCILLHPQHDQSPEQYRISQDCLVFMI